MMTPVLRLVLRCATALLACASPAFSMSSHQDLAVTRVVVRSGPCCSARVVASLGDVDRNGVGDFALWIGPTEPLRVHLMAADGSSLAEQELPTTFGVQSLASVGDLDGDGVTELAVGDPFDGTTQGI